MRFLVTLVAAAAFSGHTAAHRGCTTHRCTVRVFSSRCSNSAPRWCVLWVIAKRRIVDPERSWLLRIPGCESSWDAELPPNSSGSTGLYQFQQATWNTTPWARYSIYDARAQAQAAAWLYEKDGGGREWVCR